MTAPAPGARRELRLAVLLCLLGSAAVLLAASRVWVDVAVQGRPAPLPDTALQVTGADLVPGVRALALVGLAGVVALLAARRAGRTVVGLLLGLCGLGVAGLVAGVQGRLAEAVAGSEPAAAVGMPALPDGLTSTAWPWACLTGGLLLAAAGALAAVRGRRWAAMSRRYDAPVARPAAGAERPAGERELWEALDRGEDPT